MQIMQISSLTMHDTKIYEAESYCREKIGLESIIKINDWLINQISTGISLPIPLPSCFLILNMIMDVS